METRLIGKIISRRFRVEEIIGRGGMSIVYRAFDLKTHQSVAVKVLKEEYVDDPEFSERFRREAEVCKRLNHPNIVNLISSGTSGGISYITMEYVDGVTLKEIIKERGKLPQEEAVHYILQILAALSHAHSRGVIHRDIKPQNLLVNKNGQLKVADFGIAGIADSGTLSADDSVIGSVHYFSPEQAKGMKATGASDLYSVGIILYEMLAGRVPFEGESPMAVAMMHLFEEPEPIESLAVVSPAIAMILRKSLSKSSESRYTSAEEMTKDLRRGLRHPDGRFLEQEKKHLKVPIFERRGTLYALIATIVVLVIAVGLSGIYLYRTLFVIARMPDLSGIDQATAERMLASSGLRMDVVYRYSEMAEGMVVGQQPDADTEVRRGTTVTAVVSQGNGIHTVPRLVGYTLDEAIASAGEQGFLIGRVMILPNETMKGTVLSQEPEAGASRAIGSSINLTVSGGVVYVPLLTGLREEEAIQRISDVGLTLGSILYERVTVARQDGVVQSQTIHEYEEVLPGSAINLVVGQYDKRHYEARITINMEEIPVGTAVRVTLLEDNTEYDMYAAQHTTADEEELGVTLKSETPGVKVWRLYLDGNFKSESTAVLR